MEGLDARMQEVREGVLQIVNLQFAEQERERLDAIYERLLGRKSDLSGRLSFYMLSDEQVEDIIKESPEYKEKNEGSI
jgi:predicted CopG family antitoxin